MDIINAKQLKSVLERAAQKYYEGESVMSDEVFDEMKAKYKELTGEAFQVGYSNITGKNKTKHKYDLVGTEGKINNIQQFLDWVELRKSQVNADVYPITYVSTKMDGLSVGAEINKGFKDIKFITRGDGVYGINITHVFNKHNIKGLLLSNYEFENPDTVECGITFEAIISWTNFNYIKDTYNLKGTNPRSMLAGILSRLEGDSEINDDITSRIDLVPLRIIYEEDGQIDEYPLIPENEKDTLHLGQVIWHNEVENFYNEIQNKRKTLDYMIDGVVIEFLTDTYRNLGKHEGERKYSVALKFPYLEKVTKVINMRYDFNGVSGRVTPVVQFEPVIINGNTYQFVSLSNRKRFDELSLCVGDSIIFELRNDVLGYIRLEDEDRIAVNPIKFIDRCPSCNHVLETDENYSFCSNVNCNGLRKGKIINYLTKLGVEGIAEETISDLYDAGVITTIEDLYEPAEELIVRIQTVPRYKLKSAENFVKAIKPIKSVTEGDLLGALNIPSISTTKANLITDNFELRDLINGKITGEEFTKIHGLGMATYEILMANLDKFNIDIINFMYGIKCIKEKAPAASLNGKKVVFTGSVIGYKNRKEYESFLNDKGYKLTDTVSKDTYCVICNEKTSTSSKMVKAQKLNVPVYSQEEFYEKEGL